MKNSFVNISEVNRQCLHSLGTRSEDDFEKVSSTTTDRLLHSRVLPTAHLLGVPAAHRPGAGPPLPCRPPLLLNCNCSPVHPWLPSPHHPCQCGTPSKSSCSPNPGIKEMFLVDLYNLTNLLTTEPEYPTLKDVPPFLRRDQTDWHRYQSKYLTRTVGNFLWGWKREGGGGWELRIEFQPNFQSKNFLSGKTFLPQGKFFVNWVNFSYPNYSLSGDSGRDSFQQSESSFDWEIFYRATRCLEKQRNYHDWTKPILPLWFTQKQTKHKVMILYWIYS